MNFSPAFHPPPSESPSGFSFLWCPLSATLFLSLISVASAWPHSTTGHFREQEGWPPPPRCIAPSSHTHIRGQIRSRGPSPPAPDLTVQGLLSHFILLHLYSLQMSGAESFLEDGGTTSVIESIFCFTLSRFQNQRRALTGLPKFLK